MEITTTKSRDKCDIVIIIVENGLGNLSSNPGYGCLYFTSC